ncbi:MAG: DUF6273 domain-containing protein, partial [Lachnospiraceae bacterium]
MLLLFLCLVLCSCAGQGGEKVPSNPLVLADETLPGGSKIVWDCVYFGEYPTAEVVGTTFSSVDDYALEEGDVICDASLYEKLKSAEWKADEAVLDGARYRRLWAPSDAHARAQHYVWEEGSCHYFKYEPIKWRVLQVAAGTMTLIADRMPDCAPYNTFAGDVYWESCTLRSFLNGYGKDENLAGEDYSANAGDSFLGTAFDENERAALVKGRVENPKNYYFGTYSGEATWDYVYLPDEQEIFLTELALRQGFAKSDGIADCARRFRPTLYAMARGAWYSPVETNLGNGFWLLRTTGYTPSNVNYVCDFGCVYNRGTYVNVSDAGILPLIRVNLGKAEFVDAGTVSSSEILRENAEDDTAEAAANARQPAVSHGYSEPVVVADKTSSSGFRTTWDCLYFGQYPKTEIVAGKFKAVSDYAVDGEVLEDAELFQRLSEAKWTDDETVLEGVK